MIVRYTDTALAEIDEIFSYIARDNPVAAAAVVAQVENTVARIAQFPKIGSPKYKQGIRMVQVSRFRRYLVFYTLEGEDVVILNVRHEARRRPWESESQS